ncbi:MAG TPA: iron-sulfur cluster repair di-iron protein [Polyangiales bacterium]|nr:iron-sulfur cluster repair di-iron protein [Polyangiales bacterium]
MQLDPRQTLAELAVSVPAASRVFRRFRLDYCCSGQRTLADACRERALDPGAVLAELATDMDVQRPPLAEADCPALIDHILERYHAPLRRELPELIAMARRVETRHAAHPACPHGLAEHLASLQAELLQHLDKEERVLFPMIRAHAGRATRGPIAVLSREHGDHGAMLERTRALTADLTVPEGACVTWRALQLRLAELETELMEHIHLENNLLFPRALRAA